MTRNRLLCAAAIALVAAGTACDTGADGAAAGDEQGDVERPRTRSAPALLVPIDHSGVTGTALGDRDGDEVAVTLSLEGLRPGEVYLAHLHEDRCVADGPARVPLGRIRADDDGMTTVELTADARELPADAAWSVQIQAETGEAVACANLPPQ